MTEDTLKDISLTLRSIEAQLLAQNIMEMIKEKRTRIQLKDNGIWSDINEKLYELTIGRYKTLNVFEEL